jgi:hypothetical protein
MNLDLTDAETAALLRKLGGFVNAKSQAEIVAKALGPLFGRITLN